jgi:DnaK suppressor protein
MDTKGGGKTEQLKKLPASIRRWTMTQTELKKYTEALETKKKELSNGLRNREDIAIEKTPDALDEVQLAGERELAIRNLDRESSLLRNVRGALGRVEDGSYGVCMHCEEDIKPKRLEAVPWAKFCIRCQEAADRHEFDSESNDSDELLLNAA